ncbi:MAG TPA: LptF/LptG family permease [bacterium]|nr:LptF/LptG family permease [bacterium]
MYRYILSEMMPSFLLCVGLLTFLFMTNKVMLLLDLVLNKNVPILETLVLYLSLLPFILSMTIPMSMMVGTLLAFGRLSSDMEVTAFKSSGVHMFHLIAPVLALGLVLTGCMVFFNDKVLPAANFAFKEAQYKILQNRADLAIKEKVWIDTFENYRFLIDRQEPDGSFSNIKAFNQWAPKAPLQTTVAETGTLINEPKTYQVFFHLNNGVMSWDNQNYNTYNQLHFEHYTIRLNLENQLAHLTDIKKDYEEMDLAEIAKAISLEKDLGRRNYMKTEYQKRLALPFACLVLAWFCAPLGLWTKSKGFMGFILGLALIFVYYLMFVFGQTLSNQGVLNPVIGLWGADFILGAVGCLVYYLVVAEHSAFRAIPTTRPLAKARRTKR